VPSSATTASTPVYDLERLGAAVRRARARRSQAWLGEVTGLGQAAVSEIERGIVEPRLSTLVRISCATGVSLGEMLTWAGLLGDVPLVRSALLAAEELDEDEREVLLGVYAQLTRRRRR
jgi:transcriptional regulator with XRE-family HTH domain